MRPLPELCKLKADDNARQHPTTRCCPISAVDKSELAVTRSQCARALSEQPARTGRKSGSVDGLRATRRKPVLTEAAR